MTDSFVVRVHKGYNGLVLVSEQGVTIKRGFRGRLWHNPHEPASEILFTDIKAVRFLRAGRLVGYVQLVRRSACAPPTEYRAALRDEATVSFARRHTKEWEALAADIAERSRASVEPILEMPDYWETVHAAAPKLARGFAFGRIKVDDAKPIDWGEKQEND